MDISFFTHYAIYRAEDGEFKSVQDAFNYYGKMGITKGDLLGKLEDYPIHMHCDMLKEAGITPDCLILCDEIADFDLIKRERAISRTKEKIDILEKNKIPYIMVVPKIIVVRSEEEKKRYFEAMAGGFSRLVDYAKGSNVTVTLENQSESRRPDSRMEQIKKLLDSVDGLKFTLDSGNFYCVGEDVIEAYKMLKDKTVRMHIKDWKFSAYGDFERANLPRFNGAPIGSGILPNAELISLAKNNGFDSSLVIEINSPVTFEGFDSSIDFLKGLI